MIPSPHDGEAGFVQKQFVETSARPVSTNHTPFTARSVAGRADGRGMRTVRHLGRAAAERHAEVVLAAVQRVAAGRTTRGVAGGAVDTAIGGHDEGAAVVVGDPRETGACRRALTDRSVRGRARVEPPAGLQYPTARRQKLAHSSPHTPKP